MTELKASIEIIAPTVEEAISRGATELGLAQDELEVEVLDHGSRGVFGLGARQARVRLTIKDAAPEAPERERRPEPPSADEAPLSDDEEALRVTREAVTDLLERMGFQARIEARWEEPTPPGSVRPLMVEIHGHDLGILIGRRGETLSALQYITRLIVGKELRQPIAVVIDIEGYRRRREQQLRRLARRMAQQVTERGKTMALEPMPANERRIVHIELRDHPNVYTESIGEADRRKVTIVPRND